MTHRPLDAREIASAIRQDAATAAAEYSAKWPPAADRLRIAKAVKSRAPVVKLSNGVVFSIRYKTAYKEPTVFLRPNDGTFVPCGYFSISRLEASITEDEAA